MPLYHDIATLSVSDLLQKSIICFMQNLYSYRKPEVLKGFWEVFSKDCYPLRFAQSFRLPFVKSVRLSQLPQFKFASVFNQFPEDFKWILEKTEFLEKLRDYYHHKYSNNDCNKRICKICSYKLWKEEQQKHFTILKSAKYVTYI